jgi:hypothetical protein
VIGELVAWMVGWALILEYAVAASAVSVGWSGYANGFLTSIGFGLPHWLQAGPADTITLATGEVVKGGFNLVAFLVAMFVTVLLVLGTSKSAKFTSALVLVKIAALSLFIVLTIGVANHANFTPLLPNGWGTPLSGTGVLGAAASIFFAYVGFDAVSTAAEETENPNRNIPIGLIGSLAICTVFYLLVAYCAIGSANGAGAAQPGSVFSQAKDPLAVDPAQHRPPGRGQAGRRRGDPGAALGRADDDLRPDPHPVHHGARRPDALGLREGAPDLPHAARGHHDHRRGLRPVRGDVPGRRAGGHLQRRHPVRLLHGRAGRGHAAQVRPGRHRPFRTPMVWLVGRWRWPAACCCSSAWAGTRRSSSSASGPCSA